MAEWISDGFDLYATISDAALNYWDTAVSATLAGGTRFGVGQSITPSASASTILAKTVAVNDGTVFVAVAQFLIGSLGAAAVNNGFVFSDGATAQCGVWFEADGAIRLRAGGTSAGTILATYTSAFGSAAWNHFQVKVVIDNAAGEIHIRKNGNTVDDFSATGLDTQASANSYANKCSLQTGTGSANIMRFDDLMVYGSSGVAPNDWVGDIRCKTHYAAADTATKAFAPIPATLTSGITAQVSTNTRAVTSGTVMMSALRTPTKDGHASKITVNFNAGFTGHAVCGIWDNTGTAGAPGALVATSDIVTNPVPGNNDFTFSSPPAVSSSVSYYYGLLTDAAATLKAGTFTTTWTQSGQTYPTLPNPAGASSVAGNEGIIFATVVPDNSALVSQAAQDGDTSYVFDATVGHADLYAIDPDTTTPVAIIGVKARMFVKKSDTNAKTARLQLKGTTTTTTKDLALATTYQYLSTDFLGVDPDTSAAWTAGVVNALTVGPKVQA